MSYLLGENMTGGYGSGADILHDCSIGVERGEIAVVVGPNGAGKSTAMKAVFGMLSNVFTTMTVQENLEMGAFIREEAIAGTMEQVFELFPVLKEKRKQAAGELSGGQRQQVAVGAKCQAGAQYSGQGFRAGTRCQSIY